MYIRRSLRGMGAVDPYGGSPSNTFPSSPSIWLREAQVIANISAIIRAQKITPHSLLSFAIISEHR